MRCWQNRRKEWKPHEPRIKSGYLARYARLVTSGSRGAILLNEYEFTAAGTKTRELFAYACGILARV